MLLEDLSHGSCWKAEPFFPGAPVTVSPANLLRVQSWPHLRPAERETLDMDLAICVLTNFSGDTDCS